MATRDKPAGARVALYLRVSTDDQTIENQRLALAEVAEHRGWRIVATYVDEGISGAKSRDQRPGFDHMLRDATRGKFDVLMAWSVDRLGRSLADLIGMLRDLDACHVNLYLHQQAVDTTTPAGRALFGMLGVFAEFERAMIQARVNAGLHRARARGKKLGPKFSKPRPDAALLRAAVRDDGLSLRAAAARHGCTVTAVRDALKEPPAA